MPETMTPDLLVETSTGVVTLTLNRPDVHNAVNFSMLSSIRAAFEEMRFDRKVRAIILTGAGDRSFCAGADLKERATMPPEKVKQFIHTIRELMAAVEDFPKPVIAAINGLALGGGTELALACDMRIAADTASMGLTETSLGIIPGGGGTQRLPRLIGKGRAKELIFTARRVAAAEALEIEMAQKGVPALDLITVARAVASMISQNGPIAIEMAKWAINRGTEVDLASGLQIESRAYDVIIPTKDRLEGLAAFREKRKPVYTGD